MLKEVVNYIDYNEVPQTETLYFNLTKTELMDMLEIQPRLEAWREKTSDPGKMDTEEIKELLSIVKYLIEKSYGVRTEDGKQFRKSPEIFAEFSQTAAYDEFVFGLFEAPERAINFMIGILPKGLDVPGLAEAVKEAEDVASELTAARSSDVVPLPPDSDILSIPDNRPAWIREDRDPTPTEMQAMSKEEMQEAFRRKSQRAQQ